MVEEPEVRIISNYINQKSDMKKDIWDIKNLDNFGPDPITKHNEFINNVLDNVFTKDFELPIYEVLLNQKYFNGIGNYLRSTILYYSNINPFESASEVIIDCGERLFEFCKDIPLKAYRLNDSEMFYEWVYYGKGSNIKDSNGLTLWYNPKWDNINLGNNI